MADAKKWETQMVIFPEGGEDALNKRGTPKYEHDYPYAVEYCADGEGDRRTRKLTKPEIDQIRELNGLPSEVIVAPTLEGGGE